MSVVQALRYFDSMRSFASLPVTDGQAVKLRRYFSLEAGPYLAKRAQTQNSRLFDLHVHTDYSDGQLDALSVFRLALSKGVGSLALTDHNVVGNVLADMRSAWGEGIDHTFASSELALYTPLGETHFKLYFDPFRTAEFVPLIHRTKEEARSALFLQIESLKTLSSDQGLSKYDREALDSFYAYLGCRGIQKGEILGCFKKCADGLSRIPQSRMQALTVLMCKIENPAEALGDESIAVLDPRDSGSSDYRIIRKFLQQVLAPSKELLAQGITPAHLCLEELSQMGGLLVFAHPGRYERDGFSRKLVSMVAAELAARNVLYGLETSYTSYDPGTAGFYTGLAQELGLEQDGGSDFHTMKVTDSDGELGRGDTRRYGEKGNVHVEPSVAEKIRRRLAFPLLQDAKAFALEDPAEARLRLSRSLTIDPYLFLDESLNVKGLLLHLLGRGGQG
ncbi:MAG: hypothetical protein WC490_07630 [Candidatus Margulisiibacteriota bacterium]